MQVLSNFMSRPERTRGQADPPVDLWWGICGGVEPTRSVVRVMNPRIWRALLTWLPSRPTILTRFGARSIPSQGLDTVVHAVRQPRGPVPLRYLQLFGKVLCHMHLKLAVPGTYVERRQRQTRSVSRKTAVIIAFDGHCAWRRTLQLHSRVTSPSPHDADILRKESSVGDGGTGQVSSLQESRPRLRHGKGRPQDVGPIHRP